jgi:hypothetical protein
MRYARLPLYEEGMSENSTTTTRWSVGGLLLEALASRDFDRMADCFAPEATMRALLPGGLAEYGSAPAIVASVRGWFGGAEEFEVLDGTVGEVGGRMHLAWRLRMHPTPWGDDDWHVIEQQAYLQVGERIEAIDLVCSGFQPDPSSRNESIHATKGRLS